MAREPQDNFPEEIESDRDIRPLSTRNSKLSGVFFIVAAVIGVAFMVGIQFLGGNDTDQVVEREQFRPPVTQEIDLPDIQEPASQPVIEVQERGIDPLELERLRQLAILEEQKRQLEDAKRAAELELLRQRRRSEMLILDNSDGNDGAASGPPTQPGAFDLSLFGANGGFGQDTANEPVQTNELFANSNERFLRDASETAVVEAKAVRLPNQDSLVTQGTFISGVLETAINSDLPGLTRALVDKDVYSRTGRHVVIPKGSRLIGRYQSGVQTGQARIFIIWSRLERPDGVVVDIGSTGTDPLGNAGLTGNVDTHFFERFGASVLFTALSPLIALATDENNQSTQTQEIMEEGRQSFNRSAEIALENAINIPPTIRVPQGTEINIFVNRDLSFDAVNFPAQ